MLDMAASVTTPPARFQSYLTSLVVEEGGGGAVWTAEYRPAPQQDTPARLAALQARAANQSCTQVGDTFYQSC